MKNKEKNEKNMKINRPQYKSNYEKTMKNNRSVCVCDM